MKNKKLKLDALKVQSFITSVNKRDGKTLNGGEDVCSDLCDFGCTVPLTAPQKPIVPKSGWHTECWNQSCPLPLV